MSGKFVLCGGPDTGAVPLVEGAKGMVMLSENNISFTYPLPATIVHTTNAKMLVHYVNKTR